MALWRKGSPADNDDNDDGGDSGQSICGATLVGSAHAITAAHCVVRGGVGGGGGGDAASSFFLRGWQGLDPSPCSCAIQIAFPSPQRERT